MNLKPTLAVDFDGCLCWNKFPEIGEPLWHNINMVKEYKKRGWDIILWTCREGELLEQAVNACSEWGLSFDAINESTQAWIDYFGTSPRKIGATEYWDDKAVNISDGCSACDNICYSCELFYPERQGETYCLHARHYRELNPYKKECAGFTTLGDNYCSYCGRKLRR